MRLALIDGNSLVRPAFEVGGNGTRTLLRVLHGLHYSYSHAVVAFDSTTRSCRRELYADYKANRPDPGPEWTAAIFAAYGTARRAGFCCCAVEGWEADDVIATLARRAAERCDVVIFGRDKDFRQLLRPTVKMWHKETGMYDLQSLMDSTGLSPAQWLDFQALVGDSADNIKGVVGIGGKTAVELLLKYENIDGIYRNLDTITGRKKQLLEAGRESLLLSLELVTLNDQLEINIDPRSSKLAGTKQKTTQR
ncbi:MAG: 5'-3' exonuclease H3TH domain-containing protein [Fuerstiella sp.]